ncbi:acyltransferase [Francisella sp. Scap27]|uniref:acyltransferase family protein n=1 Tax=Francisella sp. Scap27 TaxID=2589986 RepID=UPI0015BEFCBF|nr:acyltransferase family protein [Francisella sp. Scap27]QLE79099.1 acyltransferase [Francisella sp. Scap27]
MTETYQQKYYKHIDGLRAIAVLSVVLFHLDVSWVKSGFLGVDIFFVISGFLITSIIIRDLNNDCFSIKNFYLRRMRRILPALITVLVFTTFFAWLILLPQDLKNYTKSLVSAIASVSNLYFYKYLSFGYFSTDSTVIPLLHTWSLGIEEQFYIFWPLFLMFIFAVNISWKQKANYSLYRKLAISSIILLLLSLLCFKYLSYFEVTNFFSDEKFYYNPITRAFELLFGCLLAIHLSSNKTSNNKILLNLLSVISILLILYPIFFKIVPYPSNWTIIACLGAAIYIYAGTNNNYTPLIYRVFSLKPIVGIGLISYSLYLWHWPIIAYTTYLSIEKTHLIKIIIIIISIILATLTYFLVEKPFRHKFKTTITKTILILWAIPIIIACSFALCSKYINNFGYNKSVGDYIVVNKGSAGIDVYQYPDWQEKLNSLYNFDNTWSGDLTEKTVAKFLGKGKKYDTVIFGDSHSSAAVPMINNWTKELGYSSIRIGGTQDAVYKIIKDDSYKKIIRTIIEKTNPKIFILAGWWDAYSKNGGIKYGNTLYFLNDTIKILEKYNIKPIILLDWPSLPGIKPTCGMTTLQQSMDIKCHRLLTNIINSQKPELQYIESLKQKYKNLEIIDTKKVICSKNKCPNVLNDHIIYMDSTMMRDVNNLNNAHLNEYGSDLVGKTYLKKYGNPLTFTTK